MDLTDSRGRTYVSAQLLGRIHPSWPWQNDATVVHDYAILMMSLNIMAQGLSTSLSHPLPQPSHLFPKTEVVQQLHYTHH